MSAQSSGRTPRSSLSSHPSASSSSSPYERKDGKRRKEPGLFDGKVTQYDGEVDDGGAMQSRVRSGDDQKLGEGMGEEQHEDHAPPRQRPRKSGGFLLQKSGVAQATDGTQRSSTESSEIARGKRKEEEGELLVPKRAIGRRLPKSAGGSPLANEFKAVKDGAEISGLPRDNRKSVSPSRSSNTGSVRSRSFTGPGSSIHKRDALYPDTDPAQIVNLALNLSETRRRNFSGSSALMPGEASGSRRYIPTGQQMLGIPYGTSGGSLRQQLREQRRISRNISPRSGGSAGNRVGGSSPRPAKRAGRQSSGLQSLESNLEANVDFNPSDATFARAEKARIALELGYEYRRLLQYLPAIPTSGPTTSKAGDRIYSQGSPGLGRSYNPLQYVRNRKVRFREKKPLNPEVDGWKDVDRVRAWVDTVKSDREPGMTVIDDRFPLPPFDAVDNQPTVVDSADSLDATQSKNVDVKLPTRPKMDWTFAPSDLLADVYWMDQDHNIERIEDRSWQKIIHSLETYKAGRISKESTRSLDIRKSAGLTRHNASPERSRDSAVNGHHENHERGRIRKGRDEPKYLVEGDEGWRSGKSRWQKKLLRSRSSSSSGQSDWSNRSRHRHGLNRRENFDNAALEKHMMEMLAQEADESQTPLKAMNGGARKPYPADEIPAKETEIRVAQPLQGPQWTKREIPATENHLPSVRQSLDLERHRGMSSEDLRTAPTSPLVPDLAPSIAVDVISPGSAPDSTPNTALSPLKRPFASRLGSYRRDRSRSVGQRAASKNDAMKSPASSSALSRQMTRESQLRERLVRERSIDVTNSYLGTSENEFSRSRTRTHDPKSSKGSKDLSSPDSWLKGLFRGGRIAELVGNEVSKVGDILWRKDGSNVPSQLTSPAASSHNSDTSDDNDGNGASGLDSSPTDLSPVTTNADGVTMRPSKPAYERQKYYMSNLPSFRSRFAENDQPSTIATPLPDEDHITRQQRMLKERGRSFKFERLAPPRIDMRSVSPASSPGNSRSQSRNSYGDVSRDSSGNRSTRGVRNAERRLNDMLGTPGRVGTGKIAPTGLAGFASSTEGQDGRGRPDIQTHWNISESGISAVRGTVTKRDIARVRALLLSSGVKATEITRRNDEPPKKPPQLFLDLQDIVKGPLPLLPPSQELVFAARALIADIEEINKQLREDAETFSQDVVEGLHNQIKAVDERVNVQLTPLVRAAADDADAFSTELTTTHTLAVRQLNHSVDVILRRRRRRLRWIRRSGWALLEWTVLGIMWMAWLIVVIVRMIRGTLGGLVGGVRWLLFI